MKIPTFRMLLVVVFAFFNGFVYAQEFRTNDNGLMYDSTTIGQLKYIVDSLNVKFKGCDLDRTYYSIPVARADVFSIESSQVDAIIMDLENNLGFDQILEKYGIENGEENQVIRGGYITRSIYTNYQGERVVIFDRLSLGESSETNTMRFNDDTSLYYQNPKGNWVFDRYKNHLAAYCFTTSFESSEIPEKYSRKIQYAECLIDTNYTVFKPDAKYSGGWRGSEENDKVEKFLKYINKQVETNIGKEPKYEYDDSESYDKYYQEWSRWDSLKQLYIQNKLSKTPRFKKEIERTALVALEEGATNGEFEYLVAEYYSKSIALELKRGRRVMGGCSMDRAPRIHALNIAVLAAETVNWEIFLRSHLDIMNDRFDRTAWSSYGEASFQTYIREIEELNINVPDLVFGISLRAQNVGKNHYSGNINRMGRSISESKSREQIEETMGEMISDKNLDILNRVLIYYMYRNYISNLDNIEDRKINKKKLQKHLKTFPKYMQEEVVWYDEFR